MEQRVLTEDGGRPRGVEKRTLSSAQATLEVEFSGLDKIHLMFTPWYYQGVNILWVFLLLYDPQKRGL